MNHGRSQEPCLQSRADNLVDGREVRIPQELRLLAHHKY